LLDAGDVSCNVLDGNGIFYGQAVALALDARFVYQDTSVGRETWNTINVGIVKHVTITHRQMLGKYDHPA
jgi:hypothetical protein